MELKYKIMIFLGISILLFGSLFLFSNKDKSCDWSQYGKSHKEEGMIYCCKYNVDEDGEYGFKKDGTRILNQCEAKLDE